LVAREREERELSAVRTESEKKLLCPRRAPSLVAREAAAGCLSAPVATAAARATAAVSQGGKA
jgi:hypothetical protein